MVIAYVLVLVPSWLVTTVVMVVLAPSAKAIGPDAVPEVTATPLTVMVAFACCAAGVTATDGMALTTDAVYVVVLPLVPVLVSVVAGVSLMVLSKALFDCLFTTIE